MKQEEIIKQTEYMEIKLTWHQATEGNSSLTNKVPSNRVMIPDKEPHQNHLSHVKGEGQRLLPNGIKAWRKKMFAYENHYSNILTKQKPYMLHNV